MIDWNDPAARARLIEQVGPDEYNRQQREAEARAVVLTINGHAIRPVLSRFGRIYMVGSTGSGFASMGDARSFAERQAKGPD